MHHLGPAGELRAACGDACKGAVAPSPLEFITVYGLWYPVPPLKEGTTEGQC